MWVYIEYVDVWEKLMVVLDIEEVWFVKGSNWIMFEKGIFFGVIVVLVVMWFVIDRCCILFEVKLWLVFV